MDAKEVAIKKLDDRIEEAQASKAIILTLPDGLPGRLEGTGKKSCQLWIPFDPALADKALEVLGPAWEFKQEWTSDEGRKRIYQYVNPKSGELLLCMDALEVGAACKLVIISEKVVPIYSIECTA
jgi:hypothetical protein